MHLVEKRFSTVLLALLLSACGGGSSISGDPVVAVAMQPEPAAIAIDALALESADDANTTDPLTAPAVPETVLQPDPEPEPEPEPERVYTAADITDLILVTGQSNALGLQTAFDSTLDQPHKRVFAFTDSGWQAADLHQVWDRGWYPRGNPGETPSNNFAFHMAKEIVRRHDHRVVGFILATAPGESISHWDQNGDFYNLIDSKVLDAINQIPHKSRLDGILWHQGESDEGDNQYHVKLDNLIAGFRQQNWFTSQQPFICGETAVFEVVNQQLMALNNNGDQWTGCVSSDNLSTHTDGYHFDAAGLRELGKRYATKYLAMIR
jgi:hypothetical protein